MTSFKRHASEVAFSGDNEYGTSLVTGLSKYMSAVTDTGFFG
jgi:hypothetical protein